MDLDELFASLPHRAPLIRFRADYRRRISDGVPGEEVKEVHTIHYPALGGEEYVGEVHVTEDGTILAFTLEGSIGFDAPFDVNAAIIAVIQNDQAKHNP